MQAAAYLDPIFDEDARIWEQSFPIAEEPIWEIKIKAKGSNRKRPSIVRRRNDN
jgi:hypothetical protein